MILTNEENPTMNVVVSREIYFQSIAGSQTTVYIWQYSWSTSIF